MPEKSTGGSRGHRFLQAAHGFSLILCFEVTDLSVTGLHFQIQ